MSSNWLRLKITFNNLLGDAALFLDEEYSREVEPSYVILVFIILLFCA